jgi:hypothetical protein
MCWSTKSCGCRCCVPLVGLGGAQIQSHSNGSALEEQAVLALPHILRHSFNLTVVGLDHPNEQCLAAKHGESALYAPGKEHSLQRLALRQERPLSHPVPPGTCEAAEHVCKVCFLWILAA